MRVVFVPSQPRVEAPTVEDLLLMLAIGSAFNSRVESVGMRSKYTSGDPRGTFTM
jgi:hypothetical protein